MTRRFFCMFVLLVLTAVLAAGCTGRSEIAAGSKGKVIVVASVYPVYDFARQVAGDKAEVHMLIPPGAEPHDWEPTAKDIARIEQSKLFLYHGAGLEPLDRLLKSETAKKVRVIEVSKGIPLLEGSGHDYNGHHDKGHAGHNLDPHVWLDPVYAQQEVRNIVDALCEVDVDNAAYYRQNGERLIKELEELDHDYRAALANVKRREFITSHAAFGYLAKRYNLKQHSVMGLTPHAEPTADKLARLIEVCRAGDLKYVFFEAQVNPKLSETIAREAGAGLLVLNPIGNLSQAEIDQGKNYLVIMRENLASLKKALDD